MLRLESIRSTIEKRKKFRQHCKSRKNIDDCIVFYVHMLHNMTSKSLVPYAHSVAGMRGTQVFASVMSGALEADRS